MEKQIYTTEDIHKLTGISLATIRKQVRTKNFPVKPIIGGGKGSDYLFPKHKIDEWLQG